MDYWSMSSQIKQIAGEHLAMYSNVIQNGINGNDDLFPDTIKMTSHSPLYGYLAGDELQHLVKTVDALHEKAKKGQTEKDLGTLLNSQLYWWRGRFFNNMVTESLERDRNNPNRFHDESFFLEIESMYGTLDEAIKTYASNSFLILEMMFGKDWMNFQKQLVNGFGIYTNYWNENQKFRAIEESKLK
jgi:hypothetical protein